MRKKYQNPEIQIILLGCADIIRTSGYDGYMNDTEWFMNILKKINRKPERKDAPVFQRSFEK